MKIESFDQIIDYYVTRMKNRFWKSVKKTRSCWRWVGSTDKKGYGQIVVCGVLHMTHRISWVIHHDRIPQGLQVLHKCDNKPCVNPRHLFVGTNTDNYLDKMKKKRHDFGENHAKAKLTEKQVLSIRKRYSMGNVSQVSFAKQYDVHVNSIHAILVRKTWRHI